MWPFKKKQKKKLAKESLVDITAIPDVFYGGQDPDIYYRHRQASTGESVLPETSSMQVKASKKRPISKSKISFFFSKKNIIIAGGSIFFLLATAGISWYYLRDLFVVQDVTEPSTVEQPKVDRPSEEVKTPEVIEVATSTPTTTPFFEELELVPTTTPSLSDSFFDFPALLYNNTVDLDADQLTDIEEELLGTDSGTWDTDGDGYYDGQEVVNLYNPQGEAPVKLIDSGLVSEYINSTFGYRLYYPLGWESGSVDAQAKQILFSSFSGEYVEVRVSEKEPGMEFTQWFSRYVEGQQLTNLVPFTNRFKESGMKRRDGLVAYFETDKYVYILLYHSEGRGPVPYRHVLEMMIQSFRPQKTLVEIPDQVPLPSPPDIPIEEAVTSTDDIET